MLKKSLKGGKRGGGALPLRSVLMFFFFVFAPFEFRRPDYLETKPEKKIYPCSNKHGHEWTGLLFQLGDKAQN